MDDEPFDQEAEGEVLVMPVAVEELDTYPLLMVFLICGASGAIVGALIVGLLWWLT